MRIVQIAVAVVLVAVPAAAWGAGFAHNANFIVFAPEQALAEEVLAKADSFRKEVAQEWLGEELPPGVGPVIINVVLSDDEDRGLTWPVGPGSKRKYHKMWLTTSRDRVLGSTLAHEMTHAVFATQFVGRVPPWAEEGAAGLQDDPERIDTRRRTIRWYARTGNWPNLAQVLEAETISPNDQASHSVAASVTEYLLSRADKATFLRFALEGKERGWDQALRQHYALSTVGDLQTAWQTWAGRGTGTIVQAVSASGGRLTAGTQRR